MSANRRPSVGPCMRRPRLTPGDAMDRAVRGFAHVNLVASCFAGARWQQYAVARNAIARDEVRS